MDRPVERVAWNFGMTWPRYPALPRSRTADVCIIGGGIAGVMIAHELARLGRSVILLEKKQLAHGETYHTTAHLTWYPDAGYSTLARRVGVRDLPLVKESLETAIDHLERTILERGIDCDFERLDGFLIPDESGDTRKLDEELKAIREHGLGPVERLERVPLAGLKRPTACLRFPQQAQFHPLKFIAGLARSAKALGAEIHGDTEVIEVQHHEGKRRALTRDGHHVDAAAIVVATDAPFTDRVLMHTRAYPYRSYVAAAAIPKGSFGPALLWDTAEPFHYVRATSHDEKNDLLLIGGGDHKTGQAKDPQEIASQLEDWARRNFEQTLDFRYRWSGQVIDTMDGLYYIGHDPVADDVYLVTGDTGLGMLQGALSSLLIPDLLHGTQNDWARIYSPRRMNPGGFFEFMKENMNAARQYADWLLPGQVSSPDEIAPGDGAVIREGLTKVACYRAPDGKVTKLSAICPHLGGIVRWNKAAGSWDCPCHGSRFSPEGEVLNGPSPEPLAKKD